MNNKKQAYSSNVVLHVASLRCLLTAVFLLQVGVMTFERRCRPRASLNAPKTRSFYKSCLDVCVLRWSLH